MTTEKTNTSASAALLGPQSPLGSALSGFVPRLSQQQMAARIEAALEESNVFVGESGTGTGKTFAYLVPALRSGKKVLVSTGTKALQEQIFQRDIPRIRELLTLPISVALLKGRANYLCLYRLERNDYGHRSGASREGQHLESIRQWARHTRDGDIAEVSSVPEDAEVWPWVTSTADNCLGSDCPRYQECYVNRARRQALAADVVVINHHLFFADLVLREEGFGQLLPGVDAIIFDEAHQLPEVATGFFGINVGSHQIFSLCRDSIAEELRERSGVPQLQQWARELEKALADMRLAFGVEPPRRGAWSDIVLESPIPAALAELKDKLAALALGLEAAAGKSTGFANCYRRAFALLERLDAATNPAPSNHVRWFETTQRGFSLCLTVLDVAGPFRQHLARDKAWVFTSATLTIGKSFAHYQAQLGLEDADTGCWESPFDYRNRALLYIPPDLPHPASAIFVDSVVQAAIPVLAASGGRAFVLFTSHRALKRAAELLATRTDYPLLVQGSAPRTQLLERFRASGNAVLLGTGSFWEGVDVRGEALSCVIIDKLPFASPDDPVVRARCEALEQAGQNAFLQYQLPSAVIALKQGVGRLIRDERDRGVLVLCDPRLLEKSYGKVFLESLPPMPLTRRLADVERFFAAKS